MYRVPTLNIHCFLTYYKITTLCRGKLEFIISEFPKIFLNSFFRRRPGNGTIVSSSMTKYQQELVFS